MQRLDHDTVRRMIAEREATAAHSRLTRNLSRTTPRPTFRLAEHALEALTLALQQAADRLRGTRHVRREEHATARVASMCSAPRPSATPVGCA